MLEIEGDDINTLARLHELLKKDKIKLLLPEVIELEFYKRLDIKHKIIKKVIDGYKNNIGNDKRNLNKKIRDDLIIKLNECINERDKNRKKVEKEINKIFSHKNTISKGLKLTTQLLVESYKSFLLNKKPYKEKEQGTIQSDCLIVESLKKYLETKKKYHFYFCSLNKSDFAEKVEGDNDNFVIHNDIAKDFLHIEYYINLFELLNDKFKTRYSKEQIEKLKEKEIESQNDFEMLGLINKGGFKATDFLNKYKFELPADIGIDYEKAVVPSGITKADILNNLGKINIPDGLPEMIVPSSHEGVSRIIPNLNQNTKSLNINNKDKE